MSNPIMNPIDDALIEEDKEERFLNDLKSFNGVEYCLQKDMLLENNPWDSPFLRTVNVIISKTRLYEEYDRKGLPLIHGMDLYGVKHYNYPELKLMTGSFSECNYVCDIAFGKVYRGKIQKENSTYENVIVKRWDFSCLPRECMVKHPARLQNELKLLRDSKINSHPNVAKLIGFHCERTLAVIYKGGGSSMELLEDSIRSDKFGWDDRMKVATKVGSVLETFHENKIVQSGVTSRNILVDEAYNPMICNFINDGDSASKWHTGADVCDFALLLLELIQKQGVGDRMLREWILDENLAVHNSFGIDEDVFSSVKELAVKWFKEGCSSIETTTIVTFLDELKNLVQATLPNKQRDISN